MGKLEVKVLSDNINELITIRWDGERFILVKESHINNKGRTAIVLNRREMLELMQFITTLGNG